MGMNHDSRWVMHNEMVTELRSRNFELGDYMRNPDVYITGVALEVVCAASDTPTADPIAWKHDVVPRFLNSCFDDAQKRRREIFVGAQIGAAFAKQYIEEHPEAVGQFEVVA